MEIYERDIHKDLVYLQVRQTRSALGLHLNCIQAMKEISLHSSTISILYLYIQYIKCQNQPAVGGSYPAPFFSRS